MDAMSEERMVQVGWRVPRSIRERLKRLAQERGTTAQALFLDALECELARHRASASPQPVPGERPEGAAMRPDEFEAQMRAHESYHALRVPPGQWIVVRVDGRAFSRVTADAQKPFDPVVHGAMVGVAEELVREWNAPYACTHSDEVSVLLPHDTADSFFFNRSVEKLVSISAGIASSTWALCWGPEGPVLHGGHFDARLWLGDGPEDVVDYFRWRLADAERHAVQGTLYWGRRAQGHSPRSIARSLRALSTGEMMAQLAAEGTSLASLPVELRRGTALFWETYQKEGSNPLTGETVHATRRRIARAIVPSAADYPRLLRELGALP